MLGGCQAKEAKYRLSRPVKKKTMIAQHITTLIL